MFQKMDAIVVKAFSGPQRLTSLGDGTQSILLLPKQIGQIEM